MAKTHYDSKWDVRVDYNFAEIIQEYLDTDTAKELERTVRGIFTDQVADPDMYVLGTLTAMDNEEKQKKMLEYIKKLGINHPSDVIELELCINEGSEPELKQ